MEGQKTYLIYQWKLRIINWVFLFNFVAMEISQQKFCLVGAFICHKKAGDDACAHLGCIKKTGKCLHAAGLRLHHLPDFVVSTVLSYVSVVRSSLHLILFSCFHVFFVVDPILTGTFSFLFRMKAIMLKLTTYTVSPKYYFIWNSSKSTWDNDIIIINNLTTVLKQKLIFFSANGNLNQF